MTLQTEFEINPLAPTAGLFKKPKVARPTRDRTPKNYLLGKIDRVCCGNTNRAKLLASEVADIRQWARREGFSLSLNEQSAYLATRYNVSASTMKDVIRNQSFPDPTYDRLVPLAPEEGALPLHPSLLMWILMFLLAASSPKKGACVPALA